MLDGLSHIEIDVRKEAFIPLFHGHHLLILGLRGRRIDDRATTFGMQVSLLMPFGMQVVLHFVWQSSIIVDDELHTFVPRC